MVLWRLLISTLVFRKVRAALTIAAVALAISLVVAITSGYASAEAALQQFVRYYVGSSSIEISPKGDPDQVFTEGLIDELGKDVAVQRAVGRLETEALVEKGSEAGSGSHILGMAIGVRLPDDGQVQTMKRDAGDWFVGNAGNVAVIDQVMAQRLEIGVGDEVTLLHPDRPLKVRIVGIVHKPAILAMHLHTIYLPLETLQKLVGREHKVSRVFVDLQSEADEGAFAERWRPRLEKMEPVLRLRQAGQRQHEMQKNMEGAQFISYLGGTVAMLAAIFIVFTTLSMGVAERTRSLAMLRAVGAERRQIGKLVVMEGAMLAAVGAIVGVPLGILWTVL
ncbi:MAG: ABC transporter permease, partial [Bacillota bacterium]